jgi:hypothetical protein
MAREWRKGGAQIRKAVGHLPVYDVAEVLDFYGENYRRIGKNYVVHCPWHLDTNPSFRIDCETGLSFCDPCGEGTTLERFLLERGHEDAREILNRYYMASSLIRV